MNLNYFHYIVCVCSSFTFHSVHVLPTSSSPSTPIGCSRSLAVHLFLRGRGSLPLRTGGLWTACSAFLPSTLQSRSLTRCQIAVLTSPAAHYCPARACKTSFQSCQLVDWILKHKGEHQVSCKYEKMIPSLSKKTSLFGITFSNRNGGLENF